MELTDESAHRALTYVAAVQRQGYAIAVEELESYMTRPGRRPGTPGTPGTPSRTLRTTNIDRALVRAAANAVGPALKSLAANVQAGLDIREEHVEGTPGTPGTPLETISQWLERLSWLRVDQGRLRTTALGDAMLAHLEHESLEEEIPVGVVLDQGDELASARVISRIAELGPCTVVDRFFSIESLLQIVYSTQVEAVLVGTTNRGYLAGLETTLPKLDLGRPFEIRKSDVFHDRFVLPHAGPVWLLGTSLSGLGRRLSVMVELRDATVSDAIRREFREAWNTAQPVNAAVIEETEAEPSDDEQPNNGAEN